MIVVDHQIPLKNMEAENGTHKDLIPDKVEENQDNQNEAIKNDEVKKE